MKAKPRLAWLLCFAFLACADGSIGAEEPAGGLVQVLLTPTELGAGSITQVRLLLDPQVSPSVYYPSKHDLPGAPFKRIDPVDPASPFKKELERVRAEAAVYLAYRVRGNSYYLKILRFPTPARADVYWLSRRQEGKSHWAGVPGAGNVLFTEAGQQLRPGLKARMNTAECAAGNYVVRLAPARPHPRDPGLNLLVKQMEKIIGIGEPGSAAIRSQAVGQETSRTPPEPGPGR